MYIQRGEGMPADPGVKAADALGKRVSQLLPLPFLQALGSQRISSQEKSCTQNPLDGSREGMLNAQGL